MSALPVCKDCGQSDQQRLLGENEQAWMMGCLRCITRSIISKPPVQEAARAHKEAERIRQLTATRSLYEGRRRYFT